MHVAELIFNLLFYGEKDNWSRLFAPALIYEPHVARARARLELGSVLDSDSSSRRHACFPSGIVLLRCLASVALVPEGCASPGAVMRSASSLFVLNSDLTTIVASAEILMLQPNKGPDCRFDDLDTEIVDSPSRWILLSRSFKVSQ